MRNITSRIATLENRVGIGDEGWRGLRLVVSQAGWRLALPQARCIEILDECGFLPAGPFVSIVNLLDIPDSLDAQELERFLRQNGAGLSGMRCSSDRELPPQAP